MKKIWSKHAFKILKKNHTFIEKFNHLQDEHGNQFSYILPTFIHFRFLTIASLDQSAGIS